MKRLFVIAVLLIVTGVFSQNRTGFYHIIKKEKFPQLIYTTPNPDKPGEFLNKKMNLCGKKIKGIVTMDKGVLYFDIWTIKDEHDWKAANPNCVSSNLDLENSKLSMNINRKKLSDPTYVYKIPFRARGFGLAALPLRIRFERHEQPTNVSTQLSFAFNYNFMRGETWFTHRSTTHYSWGVGPFLGLSIADIKKATSENVNKYTSDRNNPAVTLGGNIVLNRNNLGLVIATGVDVSMGKDSSNWLYQGIPWLGIGVIANIGYF